VRRRRRYPSKVKLWMRRCTQRRAASQERWASKLNNREQIEDLIANVVKVQLGGGAPEPTSTLSLTPRG